ncbi:MAG: M48 family metallopeptidase [Nitrospirae bacterium]|nr:M48 family metallopeptidase [Nitrospirota bacterium]
MKQAFLILIVLFIISCQTVPITGRQQLSLIPSQSILSMSFNSYGEFISKHKVIADTEEAHMVKRVGQKIQHAVEQYLSENGMSYVLNDYKWEFNLVEDKNINAWCMPGGKVVVYTGILPITKDETGLAVVMGHEIAHAIASHGEERMSQGLLAQMGGIALSAAVSEKPKETQNLFLTAYGLGAQIGVLLPYSRLHESEADHLGLIFMAIAGYDPRAAVDFWERMSASHKGLSVPEFLSTHPADKKRIDQIKEFIPEAIGYYQKQ